MTLPGWRNTIRRGLKIPLLLAAVGCVIWAVLFIRMSGVLRDIAQAGTESCTAIAGFLGPEDIVIDQARGVAYITRADRFGVFNRGAPPMGGIDRLDLTDADARPETLTPLPTESFFPHGLDLWIGPDGRRLLFAVNHGRSGHDHSIEIFDVTPAGDLHRLRTLRSDLLIDPNDVAAAGPADIFVTNLYGSRGQAGRVLESYAMLPRASVVHLRGNAGDIVIDRLRMANGIALSPDGDTLYVAEVLGRRVSAWRRQDTFGLLPLWTADLPMGPDNLSLAPDGGLLAAGHPDLLAMSLRMRDADRRSPSEVTRLIPGEDGTAPDSDTLFQDTGDLLTGASVAARYGDHLYIGAVFGERILKCKQDAS